MQKVLLVAFSGESTCYAHALLNAQDMFARSWDVKLIIEGAATKMVAELEQPGAAFHDLWEKVKSSGVIAAVCRACATKMGTIDKARELGLPIGADMSGHPSLAPYSEQGYQIITV